MPVHLNFLILIILPIIKLSNISTQTVPQMWFKIRMENMISYQRFFELTYACDENIYLNVKQLSKHLSPLSHQSSIQAGNLQPCNMTDSLLTSHKPTHVVHSMSPWLNLDIVEWCSVRPGVMSL